MHWENTSEPVKGVMCLDCTKRLVERSQRYVFPWHISRRPQHPASPTQFHWFAILTPQNCRFSSWNSLLRSRLSHRPEHPDSSYFPLPPQYVDCKTVVLPNENTEEQVLAQKLELTRPEAPKAWILKHDRCVSLWCETLVTAPHSQQTFRLRNVHSYEAKSIHCFAIQQWFATCFSSRKFKQPTQRRYRPLTDFSTTNASLDLVQLVYKRNQSSVGISFG